MRAPPRRTGNVPKSSRFDVLVARYYPAVYSFASRLTDDPREAIALTRDAFNSTRKQLRSCCDDKVFASILISAVIRAGLTARLNCAHIAGIRGFATTFSCQRRVGAVSPTINSNGQRIFVADAHRVARNSLLPFPYNKGNR